MSQKEPIWLKILRIALGLLFLFSSISKAVAPVNFGITMNDYFVSFGLPFLKPVALLAGVCAITCEFVLGCMMLFGVKTLLAAWGYLLFMVFFFFLTLWLAVAEYMEIKGIHYFGVVHDCGCFGQVVKMSNMTTFLKNVVIIIPTIIVFAKRKKLKDVRLTELGKWCCILLFIAIAVLFQVHCIRHLPAIDFSQPVEIFSQTTKSPAEYAEICDRARSLGDCVTVHDTICAQVANRHEHLAAFARAHDLILFVAGESSSNGRVLFDLCHRVNPRSYRIGAPADIDPAWVRDGDRVGVCGATSTPQWLLEMVAGAVRGL